MSTHFKGESSLKVRDRGTANLTRAKILQIGLRKKTQAQYAYGTTPKCLSTNLVIIYVNRTQHAGWCGAWLCLPAHKLPWYILVIWEEGPKYVPGR